MTRRRNMSIGLAMAALLGLLGLAAASPATAAPVLSAPMAHLPSAESSPKAAVPGMPLGGRTRFKVGVKNVGDETTSGLVTVSVEVTNGRIVNVFGEKPPGGFFDVWTCGSIAPDGLSATCSGLSFLGAPPPGEEPCGNAKPCRIAVTVAPRDGAEVGETVSLDAEICGGGAASCATGTDSTQVVPHFEVTRFDGGTFLGHFDPVAEVNYDPIVEQSGEPATQAGSHPSTASTTFMLTQTSTAEGGVIPTGDPKNIDVDLPAGVIANVESIPKCRDADLSTSDGRCSINSQVGYIGISFGSFPDSSFPGNYGRGYYPLYNMEAPEGRYALFGFNVFGAVFHLVGKLVKDPTVKGGYRARLGILNSPQAGALQGTSVTVWGVPADPFHDIERGKGPERSFGRWIGGNACMFPGSVLNCPPNGIPSSGPERPFFTLPTSCEGPVETRIRVDTWQSDVASSSFFSHDNTDPVPQPVGVAGCNTLDFSPSLTARPTTNVADSPSGLDVNVHVPQSEDPKGNASAHLRDITVALPEGMTLNPAAANGLGACGPAQIRMDTEGPAGCPQSSKLGTVTVRTPLLDHPAPGEIFLAKPHDNPFGSLLALYIVIDDRPSGTRVKLAGKVEPDPVTGRLVTTIEKNPQVPFEDFELDFFGGAQGPVRTPATCGVYRSTSTITPWSAPDSGPPATPSDTYRISRSPISSSCPSSDSERPNSPSFDAGTLAPLAGQASPLVVTLRRDDTTQEFSKVTLNPPPGLVGKLAGIPYCPASALEAAASKTGTEELERPSCPAASEVGNVTAGAGSGPAPYYASGKAYLIGPYRGAPLGIAIVTPAVAGPFDLGTVVVRTALHVDPQTTQITADADPVPSILEGIPLDIRVLQIRLDRPDFTLNPTSCEPMSFSGRLVSTLGQEIPLFQRFQLGECTRLGFAPRMVLSMKGKIKRRAHPSLTATLATRPGDANIKSVAVTLPPTQLLDNSHIGTVCTRVQFAAGACPERSVYGFARVTTPLLDHELSGPVYLRASGGKLPDLVPDLRGPAEQPIRLESAGKTDTVKGGLRNSFRFIPDAPFTRLTLSLFGGNRGLIQNTRHLCVSMRRAKVEFTAHNGLTLERRPMIRAKCPKKTKKISRRNSG